MSTWTSKAGAAALGAAALLLLPGCLPGGLPAFLPAPAAAPAPAAGPVLLAGAVVAAAPPGWCADPRAAQSDDAGAFLLYVPCRDGPAPAPALLTVSVLGATEAAAPDPARLDAFFRSDVGRAALSRSGEAASVTVVQTGTAGDAFLLQVRDTAPLAGAPVAPESWRAVLPLNGRLVALTALSPADPALPPATLRSVLDGFLAAMRAANAGGPATAG